MNWSRWTAQLVMGLVALQAIVGCTLNMESKLTLGGRSFPFWEKERLNPGQTEPEVRALLGDPLEVSGNERETTWRYFERFHPRYCREHFLGVIPLSGRRVMYREARVVFRGGQVADSTFQEGWEQPVPESR
jgi:hypothetical protein